MSYNTLASDSTVQALIPVLADHGIQTEVVSTAAEALEQVKALIPAGATVMNGSSRTMEQIGFSEYLKGGQHGWNNLHAGILAETDRAKQGMLRRQATLSEYYVGSVHAIAETGELLWASNSGSQLPHLAFTSPNVILVAGTQKIVPTLAEAFKRLEEYIMPLEHENMKQKYGMPTMHSKSLILHRENPMWGRKITLILVNEVLGF